MRFDFESATDVHPCDECGAVAEFVVVMIVANGVGICLYSLWFCSSHELQALRAAESYRADGALSVEVMPPECVPEYLTMARELIEELFGGQKVRSQFSTASNRSARGAASSRRARQRHGRPMAPRSRSCEQGPQTA